MFSRLKKIVKAFCKAIQRFFDFSWNGPNLGEISVACRLKNLDVKLYTVLNDVRLQNHNRTTQIDHIVVSPYGLFVIETKDYSGKIYGGYDSQIWKQYIGHESYRIYNPRLQNLGHIKFLIEKFPQLQKYSSHIHSIVVFTYSSELKLRSDYNAEIDVMRPNNILWHIKTFTEEIITQEECNAIADAIRNANIDDPEWLSQHKVNVTKAANLNRAKLLNDVCPRCGGKLVERAGRYGNFYGCSNYPNCRFTRNKWEL
ncbi:MAG: NERD domain-containing protein [Muribaculaceae bacterium]|nr:NERD domain-containing protein [Muribaculaceae bacterium]